MLFTNPLLLLSLLPVPFAAAGLVTGAGTQTHRVWLSHLSPLITYVPDSPTNDAEAGWNVSLRSHYTTNNNASIQWSYFGRGFTAEGNGTALELDLTNSGVDEHIARGDSHPNDYRMVSSVLGIDQGGVQEATLRTNQSDDSFMNVTRYTLDALVPADWDWLRAQTGGRGIAEHMSATDPYSSFYSDTGSAWEVMEAPVNQTTGTQFNWAQENPPSYSADYPYNSSILSTNRVGQPLRFTVPAYTSIFQLYGTVGPEQGRYEIRLIPTSGGDIQFQPFPLNQSYTGQRSVDSIYETKAVAYLDPRALYDVVIELQEDGKRTDLHGVSFWRYTDLNADIKDWYDESSGGLSGGQIAGIVVGSVAGAALIGLAIWFLVRRRNRSKSAAPPTTKMTEQRSTSPA